MSRASGGQGVLGSLSGSKFSVALTSLGVCLPVPDGRLVN